MAANLKILSVTSIHRMGVVGAGKLHRTTKSTMLKLPFEGGNFVQQSRLLKADYEEILITSCLTYLVLSKVIHQL